MNYYFFALFVCSYFLYFVCLFVLFWGVFCLFFLFFFGGYFVCLFVLFWGLFCLFFLLFFLFYTFFSLISNSIYRFFFMYLPKEMNMTVLFTVNEQNYSYLSTVRAWASILQSLPRALGGSNNKHS